MARVLLVGYEPETVDFSNPALPPGMSVEKIRAGLAVALKQMTDRGWEGDLCLIRPDETAIDDATLEAAARADEVDRMAGLDVLGEDEDGDVGMRASNLDGAFMPSSS